LNNPLIAHCYDNKYGIDLRSIHIESSNAKESTILKDEKFNQEKLLFSDGISTKFELVHNGNLIFLLGNKSCYPCGGIVEGAYGINWVPIFVLPTGKEIQTSSSIYKSCCVNINPIDRYLKYIKPEQFFEFVNDYQRSFLTNDWYTNNSLRYLITAYNLLPANLIFKELRARNLLNPFELSLGSIIYDFGITSTELFNCLNYSRELSPQFTYLAYLKTRFALVKSTTVLINSDDFKNFISSFNLNQIEDFFEVQYLVETLELSNFYPELMADVLHISLIKRLCPAEPWTDLSILLQARFTPVNITLSTVENYYHRIKTNIRNLENLTRKNLGYREVGSLYNERAIFEDLKSHFGKHDVFAQFSPKWLGRQRFDIYIKSLNVAIEYNGKQHYESIPFFGGDEGFQKTLARDELKRKKCKENGCSLIEIKYDEDIETALKSIMKELGILN
jgi:hypothetical protein